MTFSVLTLQKYIRGWIVRKKTRTLKKKHKNAVNANAVDNCKRNEVDGRNKNHLKEMNSSQVQQPETNGIGDKHCKEKESSKIGWLRFFLTIFVFKIIVNMFINFFSRVSNSGETAAKVLECETILEL